MDEGGAGHAISEREGEREREVRRRHFGSYGQVSEALKLISAFGDR